MLPDKLVALMIVPLLLAGCDNSTDAKKTAANDAATKAAAEEAESAKRIEARKQKRLAEEQAKKDEVAKMEAAVDAICVLPEKLPKKLDKACDAVGVAHDGFMQKHYGANPETIKKWNGAKQMQLGMTTAQCTKSGSIEVAACQANGLNTAPTELKKQIPAIFKRCIDKFGAPPEPKPQ